MNSALKTADAGILNRKPIDISPFELVPVITRTCRKYANKKNSRFNLRLGIAKNYGVSRPELRKITKNTLNMVKFNHKEMKEFVHLLWKINNNEEKTISLMIIADSIKKDPRYFDVFSLKDLKNIVNSVSSWDLADFFATEILGRYLIHNYRNFGIIKNWCKDKNPWVRRIYSISSWGYFSSSGVISKRITERSLSIINNVISDPAKPVKTGTEWALRNICKRDWKNCYQHYKFWKKIKDPTVAWIIRKSSIFMPSKFRKNIQ